MSDKPFGDAIASTDFTRLEPVTGVAPGATITVNATPTTGTLAVGVGTKRVQAVGWISRSWRQRDLAGGVQATIRLGGE